MTKHIIETVLFTLEDGIDGETFSASIPGSTAFMESCPGFIARRLSSNADGQWIEHVEWETMDAAKAAGSRIGSDPNTQSFVKCINGSSVKIFHTELVTALNSQP